MAVLNDHIRSPINIPNRENKQTFDTNAFTIDIVPLVLEDTCFAGHTFEYKWKTRQKEQFKKCNADPISTKRKRAHPTYKFGPSTDMGMI